MSRVEKGAASARLVLATVVLALACGVKGPPALKAAWRPKEPAVAVLKQRPTGRGDVSKRRRYPAEAGMETQFTCFGGRIALIMPGVNRSPRRCARASNSDH